MVWMGEMWSSGMGSSIASLMFLYAMLKQYFPHYLCERLEKYAQRLFSFVNPYIQITIHEYTGDRFKRSEAYVAVQAYLSSNSSKQAKRLKADVGKDSKNLTLSMDDHEEVTDEFEGIQFWWSSRRSRPPPNQSISFYPTDSDGKRYYKLTCHRRHRGLVTDSYLSHVLKEGKAMGVKNRQRKLYTNNPSNSWYGYKSSVWSHVPFNHPSTFRTIAMDDKKKKDIIQDLQTFSKGKEYYAKIGKAWKRGYLLYGPPGTGKSTMIAAIANFLDYDIYDLELTAVKDNNELRKLLIETSNKSVIVIEDIDCSLDLTGQRKKKEKEEEEGKDGENPVEKKAKEEARKGESKVTLSGLLNFIDGLWSACGEERLIIFTTNYLEKLDPALIRRGRMDKHVEMSYCTFGAFKVLAKNYLDLDSHHFFQSIEHMLSETQMTPADVAENLMPKTTGGDFATVCLENLIQALNIAKEEARLKAEEEEKQRELLLAKSASIVSKSPAITETKENDATLSKNKENSVQNGSS